MNEKIRNILLTVLAALLLFGFALAIPSGTLLQDAHWRYIDGASSEDDFIMMDEDEFTMTDEDEFIFVNE